MKEPDIFGAINLATGRSTLFIPKLGIEYSIWCGKVRPPQDYQLSYAVDEVLYVDDLNSWLSHELEKDTSNESKIHLLHGINSDSGKSNYCGLSSVLYLTGFIVGLSPDAEFPGVETFMSKLQVSTEHLFSALAHCRVTKSPQEIQVMHYCAYVASNAHVEVMRSVKDCEFEYELEAKFQYEIYRHGGCRRVAYTSICACGPNSAVLHYGHAGAPNDRRIGPNDMVSIAFLV